MKKQQTLEKAGATKIESNQHWEKWVLGKKTISVFPGRSKVLVGYVHAPDVSGVYMTLKAALA